MRESMREQMREWTFPKPQIEGASDVISVAPGVSSTITLGNAAFGSILLSSGTDLTGRGGDISIQPGEGGELHLEAGAIRVQGDLYVKGRIIEEAPEISDEVRELAQRYLERSRG
tara:strand:- start:567 stop:911 length:345 start_codon:yes stop_codon:yes gene_type:complete